MSWVFLALVGSTGNILINFKNDGATLSASLVIDNKSYTYTSNNSTTEGTNSTITFRYNNDYFDFTVNSDGSTPTAAIGIALLTIGFQPAHGNCKPYIELIKRSMLKNNPQDLKIFFYLC